MKRLTKEEFIEQVDRQAAVMRAEGIFIKSDITNNLSIAFELYQRILAEHEYAKTVAASPVKPNISIFDTLPRPKCIDCGGDMLLRFLPANDEGVVSQGICTKCEAIFDFELNYDQWVKLLQEEDGPK